MGSIKQKFALVAGAIWISGFVFACAMGDTMLIPEKQKEESEKPKEIAIIETWSGDYPVSSLQELPEEQQNSRVGYIDDAETFTGLWQSFKPGESVPAIDFKMNLVVFSRNVTFYNRTRIAVVQLENGVAEILAMETMSALPIEDRVAMSLAVIPREGIEFIDAGEKLVPVR